MSLGDMFQDRVNDVKETGTALKIVFNAMSRVLTVIPDDDETVQQQRARRNELREAGEVIKISDLYAYDFSDEEEEKGEEEEGKGAEGNTADESHGEDQHEREDVPSRSGSAAHHPNAHAVTTGDFNIHTHAEAGHAHPRHHEDTDHHDADENSHAGNHNSSSTSSSSSSFVSPTSMHSGVHFPSDGEGEEEENGSDASEVDEATRAAFMEARVVEESTLQLRVFDYNPRQWLLQYLCVATKLYSEESDRYLQELYVLLNFMSIRRHRIEKRSALLRERQAQQQQQQQQHEEEENEELPHPSLPSTQPAEQQAEAEGTANEEGHDAESAPIAAGTTAATSSSTPVFAKLTSKLTSAAAASASISALLTGINNALAGEMHPHAGESAAFEEESDTDLTPEEETKAAVSLPDNILRLKSTTISSFFSIYVAVMMRQEISVMILKQVCNEVVGLLQALCDYPRVPVDMVEQLHRDTKDQAESFLAQWMAKGEGRLAPVMISPPAPKKKQQQQQSSTSASSPHGRRRRRGAAEEGENDSNSAEDSAYASDSGSSFRSNIGSTVGAESVMDSEGNLIESTTDPFEGSTHSAGDGAQEEAEEKTTSSKKKGEVLDEIQRYEAMLEAAAAAHPPVEAATAHELIDDYRTSRNPCASRLTDFVLETVPGMTRSALLPCVEQPERHGFNEGYVRLAPLLTTTEEALLTRWMQVRLTEVASPYNVDEEAALVRAWASPDYDGQSGELTVLVNPTNAFRMQLSNPASFSVSGMQCDMCCLGGRNVSFQAVLESGVRSEVIIGYEGCVGYDMCVACGYYYYKACEVRLLRAVHPNSAARQPFAYGQYSKIVVQSMQVRKSENNSCNDGNSTRCSNADDITSGAVTRNPETEEWVVEVMLGVAPFGVLPIGWVLPQEKLTALASACPLTSNDDGYVELSAAEHAALPTPTAAWQQQCAVTNISKRMLDGAEGGAVDAVASANTTADGADVAAEADLCPICLQQLHSSLPVLRTLCGHWFHVECIGSHYHYKPAVVDGEVNEANGCPVCRCSDYMPSLTNVEETLRTNVYKLELRVPVARCEASPPTCAVAVGTILTEDGVYHNATNIAACTAFFDLAPGFSYTAAEAAPEDEPKE